MYSVIFELLNIVVSENKLINYKVQHFSYVLYSVFSMGFNVYIVYLPEISIGFNVNIVYVPEMFYKTSLKCIITL